MLQKKSLKTEIAAYAIFNIPSGLFLLDERRWRHELTMANETSGMRDKYKRQQSTKDVDFEDVTKIEPQGFMLENHHKEGPSKVKTTNQSKDSGIHKRVVTYIGGGVELSLPLNAIICMISVECRKFFKLSGECGEIT